MTTLALGPVIGKIGGGGAEVQKIPVNISTPSAGEYTLQTVAVPAGETWLIVVSGTIHGHTGLTTENFAPYLKVGQVSGTVHRFLSGPVGLAVESTGTVDVKIVKTGSVMSGFSGHVWAAPLA